MNDQQFDVLAQLTTYGLLHLYMAVADSPGFVPQAKRNTIIIKFLKAKLAQSEYQVAGMVDFFMVLMLPGGGDELQGIGNTLDEIVLFDDGHRAFLSLKSAAAGGWGLPAYS